MPNLVKIIIFRKLHQVEVSAGDASPCPKNVFWDPQGPETHPNYHQTKWFAIKHHQNDFKQLFEKSNFYIFWKIWSFKNGSSVTCDGFKFFVVLEQSGSVAKKTPLVDDFGRMKGVFQFLDFPVQDRLINRLSLKHFP